MYEHSMQTSDIGLTEDVKSDERKFELWTRDRSQVYVLQVASDFIWNLLDVKIATKFDEYLVENFVEIKKKFKPLVYANG